MEPEPINDDTEKRGGLEPEAFQRRLVIVTATVLVLGISGGTCLGMKIQRAERIKAQQSAETPADQNKQTRHSDKKRRRGE